MDPNVLAPWRDLSIVWFSLWMMILVAIPGVVFFFALKYLRKFIRWLRIPLLNAHVWALRIQYGTARVANQIAEVPITMHSKSAQARTTTRGIINFVRGK